MDTNKTGTQVRRQSNADQQDEARLQPETIRVGSDVHSNGLRVDGLENVAKAQAAAHYASVLEQIKELEADNIADAAVIEQLRDAIKARQEAIRQRKSTIAKKKKRKNIFARARFQLEQVDEE